jgi:hypothetical protein
MKKKKGIEAIEEIEQVAVEACRVEMEARVGVKFELPAQNKYLPPEKERAIEAAGQEIKRELFRQAIERADLELV